MKFFFIFLLPLVTCSCSLPEKKTPIMPFKCFISGMYTTMENARFCFTWDTLIIAKSQGNQNLYRVSRSSTFQRNLNDTFFPEEPVRTTWSASYDERTHVLSGIDKETDIYFYPECNTVQLDRISYIRVE